MNQLKLILSLAGLVLVVVSLVLDLSLGRPALGRVVGWVAIAVLLTAVAIRLAERRRSGPERQKGNDGSND